MSPHNPHWIDSQILYPCSKTGHGVFRSDESKDLLRRLLFLVVLFCPVTLTCKWICIVFTLSAGDKRHVWFEKEICRVRWGSGQRLYWWKHVLQPAVDVPTSVGQRRELSLVLMWSPLSIEGLLSSQNVSPQMLSSPSPSSSSGQLSQLGASLYGPQSEWKQWQTKDI